MEGAEEFGDFQVNVGGMLVPEHEQVCLHAYLLLVCRPTSMNRCVCVHTFCLFVVLQSRAGVFACIPFATLSSYKHKQVCLYAHILNL
jgi:hypothetical protein